MQLKYGNFAHDVAEAGVQIKKQALRNERGRIYAVRETWTIQGFLTDNASQATITTAINDLESAYSVDGKDLTLYVDSGSVSAHRLRNNDTLGGVRITQRPSFPKGDEAEYSPAFGRSYEIVVEADFPEPSENLMSWQQSFSVRGVAGCEKWVLSPVLNGYFQRQTVNERMPITVIQRGSAMGQFRHPTPGVPLWPLAEHQDIREITREDGRRNGDDLTDFKISWQYTYGALAPLTGTAVVP